ncbi:MAG: hypothetical protein JWO36_3721 [Myxococcales bacterium]|nr:hypothetical protein [Myxococcales bacterium]
MASAVARAQPGPTPVSATTDQAQTVANAAEQKVDQLSVQRSQLAQRYQEELSTIDRLKQQRPSWRRDRELRANLSDSADTAKQLQQVTRDLAVARSASGSARASLVAKIDAELASGLAGARAQKLAKLRAQLAPQVGPAPNKIVIPDAEIDPLADPEELQEQAAAIRVSEDQLSRQIIGLDNQVKELKEVDDLRRQHQRATDLAVRDDDQPHRNAQTSATRVSDTLSAGGLSNPTGAGTPPTDPTTDHSSPNPVAAGTTAFETQLTVTLGDVIDHSTIEGLMRASRSGDPAQRAIAAQKAREAVAARLEQLKKKRAAIEARAKSLRGR